MALKQTARSIRFLVASTALSWTMFGCVQNAVDAGLASDNGGQTDELVAQSDGSPTNEADPGNSAGPNALTAATVTTTTSTSSGPNPVSSVTGTSGSSQKPPTGTDLNGDGKIDQADINLLLSLFGQAQPGTMNGDLNHDGWVDLKDLGYLISLYPQ